MMVATVIVAAGMLLRRTKDRVREGGREGEGGRKLESEKERETARHCTTPHCEGPLEPKEFSSDPRLAVSPSLETPSCSEAMLSHT